MLITSSTSISGEHDQNWTSLKPHNIAGKPENIIGTFHKQIKIYLFPFFSFPFFLLGSWVEFFNWLTRKASRNHIGYRIAMVEEKHIIHVLPCPRIKIAFAAKGITSSIFSLAKIAWTTSQEDEDKSAKAYWK